MSFLHNVYRPSLLTLKYRLQTNLQLHDWPFLQKTLFHWNLAFDCIDDFNLWQILMTTGSTDLQICQGLHARMHYRKWKGSLMCRLFYYQWLLYFVQWFCKLTKALARESAQHVLFAMHIYQLFWLINTIFFICTKLHIVFLQSKSSTNYAILSVLHPMSGWIDIDNVYLIHQHRYHRFCSTLWQNKHMLIAACMTCGF